MRVLVLNAGSRSLKWSLLTAARESVAGADEPWKTDDREERAGRIREVLRQAPRFDVVGHRLAHGGTTYREAVVIDEAVRRELGRLVELDPEHMLPALAGIDAVSTAFPDTPQVAAFDTTFHRSLPEAAAGYALPFEWTERWELRRFGFHGLSVAYAVRRARELLGGVPARMVVCHLGGGCSATAVRDGASVDTTMGFSPLEGLMMTTRAGSVDPGLLLHLQSHRGVDVDELRDVLTARSGLLGVSGISQDLREVVDAADRGSARARLAYDRFVLSVRRGLGAMAGVLGGAHAVVFTGGIGENSARVRRDAVGALGLTADDLADNEGDEGAGDRDIAKRDAPVRVLVVRSREDLAVLEEVLRLTSAE